MGGRLLEREGQDKTRKDIYYHNITSTIFWLAVSKKTLVEACQINSITNQILHIISKKQRKRKEEKTRDVDLREVNPLRRPI